MSHQTGAPSTAGPLAVCGTKGGAPQIMSILAEKERKEKEMNKKGRKEQKNREKGDQDKKRKEIKGSEWPGTTRSQLGPQTERYNVPKAKERHSEWREGMRLCKPERLSGDLPREGLGRPQSVPASKTLSLAHIWAARAIHGKREPWGPQPLQTDGRTSVSFLGSAGWDAAVAPNTPQS